MVMYHKSDCSGSLVPLEIELFRLIVDIRYFLTNT